MKSNNYFNYKRSHTCGELRNEMIGQTVTLSGWVNRFRDHGGLIFIDLRDRYGITQVVFDPAANPKGHHIAETLRSEWVVSIYGQVRPRAKGMANPKMATGDIEIEASSVQVLSRAETPPFSICDELLNVHEELRLKYRYLDLRRGEIARNLFVRHKAMLAARRYLDSHGFCEISTPILAKSTPEGARDYLVPSRIHPGRFYALPQSPQLFKQLLMIGGMDRYFQIATCFRDEDLRADRQPEFTQIDLEMSFGTPDDILALIEECFQEIFKECLGIKIQVPFCRMRYNECIDSYGTDRPDLRFGMPLRDISDIAAASSFSVFLSQLKQGGIIKGLSVEGGADISRRLIDEYTAFAGQFGIKGLAWMKVQEEGLVSNIVKFFPEGVQKALIERFDAKPGDLLFFVADSVKTTNQALDHLRRKIAKDRGLIKPGSYKFLWVTDFPLMEWDSNEGRYLSVHHPFTAPHPEDLHLLDTDPAKVRSLGYDIVLNGYEIGGGSQRIHDSDLQMKIFSVMEIKKEEAEDRFGFFLNALTYGTPPHLGIALGLDRIVMLLQNTDNIRDVIAFPKTQRASDLMLDCPSHVFREQLTDLHIAIDTKENPSQEKEGSLN